MRSTIMKPTIILYTEDSHDNITLSLITALWDYSEKIVIILPLSKLIRIQNSLNNDLKKHLFSYSHNRKNTSIKYPFLRILENFKILLSFLFFYNIRISIFLKTLNLKNNSSILICQESYSRFTSPAISKIQKVLTSKVFKSILVIHNLDVDSLFSNQNSSLETYKNLHFKNSNLYRKFDNYIFFSESLIKKLPNSFLKKSVYLPAYFTDEYILKKRVQFIQFRNEKSLRRLVIPGYVDSKRRDYEGILNVLSGTNKELFELIFLGSIIEEDIIDKFKSNNINIEFFDNFLNAEDFRDVLINSDLIIYKQPLQNRYGVSKMSGIPFDAGVYGLPLVVIDDYLVDDSIEILRVKSSYELNQLITNTNGSLDFAISEAIKKMENFSIKTHRKSIEKLLKN